MEITQYIIDWSELLKQSFVIGPSQVDGPGTKTQHTTLRLYGRNYVEWGETFDENFAKMVENFASPAYPINPTSGQIWSKIDYYARDYSLTLSANTNAPIGAFYRYNYSTNGWESNDPINFSVMVVSESISTYPASTATVYVYSLADQKLYYWDSLYQQAQAGWIEFTYTGTLGLPTTPPAITVAIYNGSTEDWESYADPYVSNTPPSNVDPGTLWYDISDHQLKYWLKDPADPLDLGQWVAIPLITGDTIPIGNIDLLRDASVPFAGYGVINLPDATEPQDLINLQTLNARLDEILSNVYVRTANGLMTGTLNFVEPTFITENINTPAEITFKTAGAVAGTLTTEGPIELDTRLNISSLASSGQFNALTPITQLNIGSNIKLSNVGQLSVGTGSATTNTPISSANFTGALQKVGGYLAASSLRWTMSFWIKKSSLAEFRFQVLNATTPALSDTITINNDGKLVVSLRSVNSTLTSAAFISATTDFVNVIIHYNAGATTPAGRVRAYINNVETDLVGTVPSANVSTLIGTNTTHTIENTTPAESVALYDFYLVKDATIEPTGFGAVLANRIWAPVVYQGSYIGTRLPFAVADISRDVISNVNWTFTAGTVTTNATFPTNVESLASYPGRANNPLVSAGNLSSAYWSSVRLGTNGRGTKYLSYDEPTPATGVEGDVWYQLQ